jgi:hypothetical protein
LPLEAVLADCAWLAELACWLCELLEEFCAWLLPEELLLPEGLLRLEAFLPALRVALPVSVVLAPLLELEDCAAEEGSEVLSAPKEEWAADDDECEDTDFGGDELT